MMSNKKLEVFPNCFDWSEELVAELQQEHDWELVAGFLDVDCTKRLVSEGYYENRQGRQLFVRDLPPVWMAKLHELIEQTTGYTGCLMAPRIIEYKEGEEFKEHCDHAVLRDGNIRTQSFCVYLTEPEAGGELYFNYGIVVRPRAGMVATFNPRLIHASLPVEGSVPKIMIVTWFVEEDDFEGETVFINAGEEE